MNRLQPITVPGLLAGLVLSLVAGCSGGSSGPSCSLNDPATLDSASPWPKFRADVRNSGAVDVSASPFAVGAYAALATLGKQASWVFPPLSSTLVEAPKGAFSASPVIDQTGGVLYIGSNDGTLYAVDLDAGTQATTFNLTIAQPIGSTALVGLRNGTPAIFVGGQDGRIYAVDEVGNAQASNWPFSTSSAITTSPNLGGDGTVYLGSQAGIFGGVCPNGVGRFGLSFGGSPSSAAIGPDGTIYFGGDDSQLRAVTNVGVLNWAFSTSAPISGRIAPVVEADGSAIYIADVGGRLFKVDTNGRPIAGFSYPHAGPTPTPAILSPIHSSPALTSNRLYFGTDDGVLHAVDNGDADSSAGGMEVWSIMLAPGFPITSSPAVACDGSPTAGCEGSDTQAPPLIVVGANDGKVYFVADNGDVPRLISTFDIGLEYVKAGETNPCTLQPVPTPPATATVSAHDSACAVRSSPAIGQDGTVYVGADDGRVYAIGAAESQ